MPDSDPQSSIEPQSSSRRLWRRLVWATLSAVTLAVSLPAFHYWRREAAIQQIENTDGIVLTEPDGEGWLSHKLRGKGLPVSEPVVEVDNISHVVFRDLSTLETEPIRRLGFLDVQFPEENVEFLSRMEHLEHVKLGSEVKLSDQALIAFGMNQTLKKLTLSNDLWRVSQLLTPDAGQLSEVWDSIWGQDSTSSVETPMSLNLNFLAGSSECLKHLNHLEVLEIQKRILSENDLHSISQLKALRELKLIDCRLPEEGMKSLTELSKLRYLGLNGSPVTSRQLQELRELPKLEQLHLPGIELSKEEMEQVKAAFEHCKVTGTYGSNSTEEKSEPLPLKLITK